MSAPTPRPSDPRAPRGPSVAHLQAAVTEVMAALDDLDGLPLGAHVEAFERVHAVLGDALAAGSA